MNKSLDELMKEQDYQVIASILMNNNKARKDNRVLIRDYYKKAHNISIDNAFKRDDVLNYQTIERMARTLKMLNHNLQYDKSQEVEKYKQIGLDIPVSVRLI